MMLFFWSCAPPDAPETLDELGSYLFSEFQNPDPRYMKEGLRNLDAWLSDNREDVIEGYRIENLSTVAVNALQIPASNSLDGLIGAAVATDTGLEMETVLEVSYRADPMLVAPDAYGYYNRVWGEDAECFFTGSCNRTTYDIETENILPLGIVTQAKSHGEYLRVVLPEKEYIIQRRWFTEPASCNQDWLKPEQDYAISVFIPLEDGMRFMDMEWVVTKLGDMPFPEDLALSLAIGAIQDGRRNLENYINENY